ncbi:MAG TPA: sigma-54 dependent transcriptional regulator [Planctomycetota bacterium]|nr:sigma-54 dependent transcriptional regulator [Planctomycetota bacterium]
MREPFNLLMIDDDPAMRDCCSQALSRQGCRVRLAENGEEGLAYIQRDPYDVVLLDLKMPGIHGLDVLDRIRLIDPDVAVIVITGYATVEGAVRSMKNGAFDFIPKPFTPAMLRSVVARALQQHQAACVGHADTDTTPVTSGTAALIGETHAMRRLKKMVRRIAASGSTVLITGESGTGKELVARALHHHSSRANEAFVVVDCGCLVDSLAEAELFGHVKGAFTGADITRQGRFHQAHCGTIFLDEISNTSASVQHKLLRVLQEFEITPVGSSEQIDVNVRVIAATNTDLSEQVKRGSFRKDLYYRLNVIPICLPALRERKDDIPLLAEHFFDLFNSKLRNGLLQNMTSGAMRVLSEYDWPGNVREMENAIERATVLCEADRITEQDFAGQLDGSLADHTPSGGKKEPLFEAEKEHIREVLIRHNYNLARSAKALQIDRKTLRGKARKYGLIQNHPPSDR